MLSASISTQAPSGPGNGRRSGPPANAAARQAGVVPLDAGLPARCHLALGGRALRRRQRATAGRDRRSRTARGAGCASETPGMSPRPRTGARRPISASVVSATSPRRSRRASGRRCSPTSSAIVWAISLRSSGPPAAAAAAGTCSAGGASPGRARSPRRARSSTSRSAVGRGARQAAGRPPASAGGRDRPRADRQGGRDRASGAGRAPAGSRGAGLSRSTVRRGRRCQPGGRRPSRGEPGSRAGIAGWRHS